MSLFLYSCDKNESENKYSPGIYIGDFSLNDGVSNIVTALVSKSSEMRFPLSGGHVKVENINNFPDSSVVLEVYQDLDTPLFKKHNSSLIFTDNPNFVGDITGSWTSEDRMQSGILSLSKSSKPEVSQSLVTDSYNWILQFGSSGGTSIRVNITTNPSGIINGNDDLGCVYSGNFDPQSGIEGVYSVTVDISSCGSHNGSYSGITAIDPIHDSLFILVSNEIKSITLQMNR